MSENTILIALGALLTAVGVLGGGFEIKEVRVPTVGTVPRALALVIGLALIGRQIYPELLTGEGSEDSGSHTERENWARSGEATQSSDYSESGGEANLAIDGIQEGAWQRGSVTHTANEENSWWQVLLTKSIEVGEVKLYNRTDCCGERLSNFRLTLEDDSEREVFSQDFLEPVGTIKVVPVNGVRARIVRVELLGRNKVGNGYLSLAEVEVYGRSPQ